MLLLAVLHRPIFFAGTRYLLNRVAQQQQLDLSYEIRGSIFTTLSVVDLRATPTESGPIQRLDIGTLNLTYSLWNLIRDGFPAFLKEVDIRNVFIELTPEIPPPAARGKKPQSFKFPALFPELLNLENFNLLIHSPQGDTTLEGFFFSLLPDRPGSLKLQTLDIPGVRRWTDIAAATTYRKRNLVLSDLFVGTEIALRELNLDLTELEKAELSLGLNGTFFDAPVHLTARVTDLNRSNHLTMKAEASELVFEPMWEYFHLSMPVLGELEHLDITFEGTADRPTDWQGAATAKLKNLSYDSQVLGEVTLEMSAEHGLAQVALKNEFDNRNSLTVNAEGELPTTLEGFTRTRAKGQVHLLAPETERLHLPEPLVGDLAATGDFTLADGLLIANLMVTSQKLAAAEAELTDTEFSLRLEKDLSLPADAPFFQTLATTSEGTVKQARFRDYVAEALRWKATSREERVTVEELALSKESNTTRIRANYLLPPDGTSWSDQPFHTEFSVEAPNLAAFVVPDSVTKLKGRLRITGKARLRNQLINGELALEGHDIEANGIPIQNAEIHATATDNQVSLALLHLALDDKNHIEGSGNVQWGDGLAYQGDLNVHLTDLSIFQSLLGEGPDQPRLGGALTLLWKGEGDTQTPRHSGTANLDLTEGQFSNQKNLTAQFKATYGGDHINIPDFLASSDFGRVAFSLFWRDNQLKVTDLVVRQNKISLLEGQLALPLRLAEWKNPARFIPPDEPVRLILKSKKLDLPTILRATGHKDPPLVGTADLDVDVQGPLRTLQGRLTLRASGLQSPAANQLAPASVSLDVTLQNNQLSLDGTIQQKRVEPLRLTGRLPFDAATILERRQLPPETPLDLKVQLPRSSLDFLSAIIAPIRQSRGFAAVDVTANGTLAQPILNGSLSARLDTLRFSDPMLPPIDGFDLRVDFVPGRISLTRCNGGIAGGTFSLGGKVDFTLLHEAILDLRFRCKNALVLQNDAMTVRVTSDLGISGPWQAGTVKGTADITRSRFFKNIDILPIALQGRPAPQPPEEFPAVSFPKPPLRDWKFDVAIRTADPFLVQGNLANGRITANLQMGGTGLAPWLDGKIEIRKLTASLPFSRLEIQSGEIFFDRQHPFMPQFNLDATSNIRDYRVTVSLAGPITDPQTFFASEPPLTQAAVVSLLATGLTPQELGNNPGALAGRATMLLFQQLYQRVFQRNARPSSNTSFLDQIRFDIGITDPKSGRQSTTVGVPLTKQFMLTGGMDVGGDFQGQVKYLIRFK